MNVKGVAMTVSELIHYIKKRGARLIKHGASHDEYQNPLTGGIAQIPRHPAKELKKGTLERILKDLGLK
jgi:predicted RNA binding protein YcfA (HicA-like mRNA interferase family)